MRIFQVLLNMKQVLFLTTKLGGGGAERVMSYIIAHLAKKSEYQVSLLLLQESGNTYLDMIPSNVKIENLKLKHRIRYSIIPIVRGITKRRPHICFIGLDRLNILLAPFIPIFHRFGIKFIVRETTVLSQANSCHHLLVKFLYRRFYNQYDRIIAQSKDMKEDLVMNWGIYENHINLINNPVDIQRIVKKSRESIQNIDNSRLVLIALGRLTYQKGLDILLTRLAELPPNQRFDLLIVGQGELEQELKQQCRYLGLNDYVTFMGFQKNPYPYIACANGIVLSSRYEGFPNVLLEANALGVPIFANRCPGGINEIVIEGITGISCDFTQPSEFQEAWHRFSKLDFDASKIVAWTEDRYGLDRTMIRFDSVFDGLL